VMERVGAGPPVVQVRGWDPLVETPSPNDFRRVPPRWEKPQLRARCANPSIPSNIPPTRGWGPTLLSCNFEHRAAGEDAV
jgi:hypothetical protein